MDIGGEQIEAIRCKAGYRLAVEAMRDSELRARAAPEHFKRTQRMEFFMLMAVTKGRTLHTIDFAPVSARAAKWMLVRPRQMQRFDFSKQWVGWVVVFRQEFLPPENRQHATPFQLRLANDLDTLPNALQLSRGHTALVVRRSRGSRRMPCWTPARKTAMRCCWLNSAPSSPASVWNAGLASRRRAAPPTTSGSRGFAG